MCPGKHRNKKCHHKKVIVKYFIKNVKYHTLICQTTSLLNCTIRVLKVNSKRYELRPIIGELVSLYGFLRPVSTNLNVLGMNQTNVFCLKNIYFFKESTK